MTADAILKTLLQQATTEGTRSTALKSLGWLIAMLLPSTLGAFALETPNWLGVSLAVATGVSVTLYLFAYVYLLRTDRDALRSERYSLTKLAIEKGVYGDSTA